jgi:cytochrome o ubiquinol oxidase subunit I
VPHRPFAAYRPIHMPRNTGTGIIISAFAAALGFALIWHIWWLAIAAFVAALAVAITHSFNEDRDYYVSSDEVAHAEGTYFDHLASQA